MGGVRARGAGRAARLGDPRRQQRARHRHRPARRQAHARRAPRPRAHAHALRGDAARARTSTVALPWLLGSLSAWLLLPLADAAARRRACSAPSRTHTDGPTLNARARRHRAARVPLLRAARRRPAALLTPCAPTSSRSRCACASRCGPRTARSRERDAADPARRGPRGPRRLGRGRAAGALRRRLADAAAARRSRRTRRRCAAARSAAARRCSTRAARADPLPQALAAVDLALWSLAGHPRGRPVVALLADDALDARPGQRDDRRRGPRGRRGAGGRRGAARASAA